MSLLSRIREVRSYAEALPLLDEGKSFRFASKKTKRRWIRAAQTKK